MGSQRGGAPHRRGDRSRRQDPGEQRQVRSESSACNRDRAIPTSGPFHTDRETSMQNSKSGVRTSLTVVLLATCMVIAGATVGLASDRASAAIFVQASPTVATVDGSVQGATVGATDQFLGIPYAAPPVGSLR